MGGVVRRRSLLLRRRSALRVEDLGSQPVGVGLAHGVDVRAFDVALVMELARKAGHTTAVRVDVEASDVVVQLDELLVDLVLGLTRQLACRRGAHVDELPRVGGHVDRGVGCVVADAGKSTDTTHGAASYGTGRASVQGLLVVQVVGKALVLQAVLGALADQVLSKFRAKFTGCAGADRLGHGALDARLCQRLAGPHGHGTHSTRHEALQGRLDGPRHPCGIQDLTVALGGPNGGVHHGRAGRLVGHLVVTGQGRAGHRPKLGTPQAAGGEATGQPASHGGQRRLDGTAHVAQSAHGPLGPAAQAVDVGEVLDRRCPGAGQLGGAPALGLQLLAGDGVAGLVRAGCVPQELVCLLAKAGGVPPAGELAGCGGLQGLVLGEGCAGVVHLRLRGRGERRHRPGSEVSHHLPPLRKNLLNAAFSSSVRLLYWVLLMWSPWSVTKPPRRPAFTPHRRRSVPPSPA